MTKNKSSYVHDSSPPVPLFFSKYLNLVSARSQAHLLIVLRLRMRSRVEGWYPSTGSIWYHLSTQLERMMYEWELVSNPLFFFFSVALNKSSFFGSSLLCNVGAACPNNKLRETSPGPDNIKQYPQHHAASCYTIAPRFKRLRFADQTPCWSFVPPLLPTQRNVPIACVLFYVCLRRPSIVWETGY
jgi:hypothetical protein